MNPDVSEGVWVLVAVLVLATGFGVWRAEPGSQLTEEREVDVDLTIGGTIEGTGRGRTGSAPRWGAPIEHDRVCYLIALVGLGEDVRPGGVHVVDHRVHEAEEPVVGVERGRGVALDRCLVEIREDVASQYVPEAAAFLTTEDLGTGADGKHDQHDDEPEAAAPAHRDRQAAASAAASSETRKAHAPAGRAHASTVLDVRASPASQFHLAIVSSHGCRCRTLGSPRFHLATARIGFAP